MYYIIKSLRQLGNTPTVLSLTQGEYWEQGILELGVPVIWVGQSQSRVDRLRRVMRCVDNIKADILQSQHFYTNLYVALVGKVFRIPHIGAVRNDATSEIRDVGGILGTLSLRAPGFLAANSKHALLNAMSMGAAGNRMFFLPNVVDTTLFRPPDTKVNTRVRLLAAGRLVEQKRLDRFISVVARLRSRIKHPIHAAIVGTGPLEHTLKAQAGSLLSNQNPIEFCGAVSDMQSVYRRSDVFVLTSDWEGTPNVALEAMAAGLPIVATSVGGVSDIVLHGKTGFLAEPADEAGMVGYIETLAKDSVLRNSLGSAGRRFVEMHHSLENLPHHLEMLYSRLLS